MDVAVATDRPYLPWCATAVLSCAQANAENGLRLHVLHAPDVGADDQARLDLIGRSHGAEVVFHVADDDAVAAFPSKGVLGGGRTSWLRVVLTELLPELERVIYLDADTLVVESLAPLWETPLGDAPLAAVANVTEPAEWPHVASLGVGPRDYFNAGVLVVDLARWRAEGATEALIRYVEERRALSWFDQDALNAVFAGRWKRLHPKWNAMNSFWMWADLARDVFGREALDEAKRGPAVLHFEGPSLCKPWHYLCDHPWRATYLATLARTPWADTPLTDRTVITRLIRTLPRGRRADAYHRFYRLRERARAVRSGALL